MNFSYGADLKNYIGKDLKVCIPVNTDWSKSKIIIARALGFGSNERHLLIRYVDSFGKTRHRQVTKFDILNVLESSS